MICWFKTAVQNIFLSFSPQLRRRSLFIEQTRCLRLKPPDTDQSSRIPTSVTKYPLAEVELSISSSSTMFLSRFAPERCWPLWGRQVLVRNISSVNSRRWLSFPKGKSTLLDLMAFRKQGLPGFTVCFHLDSVH